ncbi:MAG: GGDEF domain-containing protein, partial [Phascolarctobacterium sp.]
FNNRKFDFALEKSRLPYISGVVASMDDPNDKYIYHAVKIERQGEVLGILYGFINLQDFAKHINLSFFDGNAQLFIADGETGDFLVDTWHKKLGNIFDGTILKRKVKDGYDFWQMKQDFVNNKEGHIAFWSNTAQEYFYSYYQPIGVNKWMVQLTVLESKAFANAIKIRKVVYFLGFVVLMSFLLCLQWLWRQAKKDMQLKEELSNTDVLTDLHNRNCYEQKLEHYAKHHKEGLCCLYLDVNGLHELNNTLGHEAGNEMLVYVANTLKTFFGRKHCYRIGGDEFVVFLTDCSPEEVAQRLQQCNESIESQNYHVSVGEAWLEQGQEMNDLVRIAESRMYEAKRAYYERGGNVAKARLMNQKLEQILLEKKDAETFLRTISSRFMGVYIVDTAADIARVIFKPSYFSELLDV